MRCAVERLGWRSEDHRAARAGRSGGRSLGAGGFRRLAGALQRISKWNLSATANGTSSSNGAAGVRYLQVVPPGIGIVHQVNLEYLAKGVLSDVSRSTARSDLLPRHAGRHRFAHDDDQRSRHRRLGRRRHRSRGGHARAAGLFPDAGRRGRAPDRPLRKVSPRPISRCTSRKCCARRKVVGKFVEFFGEGAERCRSWIAPPSPTWRPNTARRWVSSRSTTSGRITCAPPAAARSNVALSRIITRHRALRHAAKGRDRILVDLDLDLATVQPSVAGPKTPAGPHRSARAGREVSRRCFTSQSHENGFGKADVDLANSMSVDFNGSAPDQRREPRPITKADQRIEPRRSTNEARNDRTIARRPIRARCR